MRVKVVGVSDVAKALRGLLRKAGFAITEYIPAEVVVAGGALVGGYVVYIEEGPAEQIHFDSVDCELEANILRHVTALSKHPVVVDRPGGVVHSDREIRIVVPAHLPGQQMAVEFGVMRGLVDTVGKLVLVLPQPQPWWKRIFRRKQ